MTLDVDWQKMPFTPPRPLEEIEGEIRGIEQDILRMLAEVTGERA